MEQQIRKVPIDKTTAERARDDAISVDTTDFTALARCIDAIGTAAFPGLLSKFCADLCSADSVFLSAFFDHHRPVALYTNHEDESIRQALQVYTEVAYVLDPFFSYFGEKRGNEVLHLDNLAPDNFKGSEYYDLFYKAMCLEDECGLMIHIGEDAALFFSFGVHAKTREIQPSGLATALPLLVALANRHWTILTAERTDGTGRLATHLELAFNMFGSSVLSPREGDVVRLIMRGHSSKAIAGIFGNSPDTIKVHRKRAYDKLGITSQGELLSLFLSALAATPPTSKADPLVHFQAKPSAN